RSRWAPEPRRSDRLAARPGTAWSPQDYPRAMRGDRPAHRFIGARTAREGELALPPWRRGAEGRWPSLSRIVAIPVHRLVPRSILFGYHGASQRGGPLSFIIRRMIIFAHHALFMSKINRLDAGDQCVHCPERHRAIAVCGKGIALSERTLAGFCVASR